MSFADSEPILITGFEPFGRLTINPSQRLADAVGHAVPTAIVATLPTSYEDGWSAMSRLLRAHAPKAVLIFGYAASVRSGLRIDPMARNASPARTPDNTGRRGKTPIMPSEPTILTTHVPVSLAADAARGAGTAVHVYDSASGYVCNAVYFQTLAALRQRTPCLLVHVGDWERRDDRDATAKGALAIARAIANASGTERAAA